MNQKIQDQIEDLEPKDDQPNKVEKLLHWQSVGPNNWRHKEFLALWTSYSVDNTSLDPWGQFHLSWGVTQDDSERPASYRQLNDAIGFRRRKLPLGEHYGVNRGG